MLAAFSNVYRPSAYLSRWFQSSAVDSLIFKQKSAPQDASKSRASEGRAKGEAKAVENQDNDDDLQQATRHVKRNEVGVQLLSRKLHSQVFRNVSFPPPKSAYVQIAQEHLQMHGLDPSQGSVLPDTAFQLPPLQGSDLSEHFHRIGTHAAEPWLGLAKTYASVHLPPKPDGWDIQSGWTKYHFRPDGSSYSEHVEYPMQDDGTPEQMLTFDVETMPPYHPYAIMACAASETAWYAWISPWLLGQTEDPQQLIPFGDPKTPRVVVGHNVSYDRGRIREEYSVESTMNRFIDTMALHVAIKGISSHQRPAWMKYKKNKDEQVEQREEAVEAVVELIDAVDQRHKTELDADKKEELRRLRQEMTESLSLLQQSDSAMVDPDVNEAEITSKRWEELTSANSLADVAKLHCGIQMDKQVRSDFMSLAPTEIRDNVAEYLDYCCNDVYVTHCVYATALPTFLQGCPHPVSFAGILTMGSSFLTVNQEWEAYLKNAEDVYREMEEGVQRKLKKLAEDAKALADAGDESKWKNDPWLSQLDWTPKIAGKSRGMFSPGVYNVEQQEQPEIEPTPITLTAFAENETVAYRAWYAEILSNPFSEKSLKQIIPIVLRLSYDGHPLRYHYKEGWHYLKDDQISYMDTNGGKKAFQILNKKHALQSLQDGKLTSVDDELLKDFSTTRSEDAQRKLMQLTESILTDTDAKTCKDDPWLCQLDWKVVELTSQSNGTKVLKPKKVKAPKPVKAPPVLWPKWYWEATKPRKDLPPGTLEITVRNRIAPLLLRLSWLGHPLVHSREHGWTFRVPAKTNFKTRSAPLSFYDPVDEALADASLRGEHIFYKLPHKDGDRANVGNPLAKTFMKYAQDGTLKSPGDEATEALDMNAQCSYWISARDRILNQTVLWQDPKLDLGFAEEKEEKWGIILPQVITMGTVTRRAIEKTWLTASNAKKNRVGSELKAMVRAPKGYSIVGADVDSEELWISSCMGDAQFGLHGATALGWMTLEGTKGAGTDLHSKTASILGISRDQAKVFNYSRIYGAGMRHAVLLLLQSNAGMLPEQAQKLAENLYASTKGKNTHRTDIFERKFWFGGTESYVFNKLEEIALSDKPQTPALGCGVTYALSKEYLPAEFGSDYMPSRINWVVQSSGVDYLHLLIVSMDHLIAKYDIKARYLISVHDELRYLVKDEDRYRAALALQIANLWTRSLFAYKLGMDDLPQGVAFFFGVDIDKVLRKEVDMPCVTPSQPNPIPPGECLDITGVLKKTNGGSLWSDGRPMAIKEEGHLEGTLDGYLKPNCLVHRASSAAFLKAQATTDFGEVKGLAQKEYGKKFIGGVSAMRRKKITPIGNGEGFDWSETVERLLKS
ncbi:DNA polymerase family A-domain-containing protein [Crucibulum laeve]|uniref:Mitochondrial DNA polymerase catalytic subunit n=1 Tax=Crucibulum laeve TaxID=68775 RepID=A0A5C3MBU8_9AGAR|nr:DNA polymerase family A-domain-containing protein [Crucibulum laeve]